MREFLVFIYELFIRLVELRGTGANITPRRARVPGKAEKCRRSFGISYTLYPTLRYKLRFREIRYSRGGIVAHSKIHRSKSVPSRLKSYTVRHTIIV